MIPYIVSNDPGTYVTQQLIDDKTALGRIAKCISCKVTEQLNGEKVADLRVPMDALHSDKIVRGGLLLFDDSEDRLQLWRVESITKTFADGVAEVHCNHISYDLNNLGCLPFSVTDTTNLMSMLRSRYVSYIPFTFSTTVASSNAPVSIQVPTYYRDIIGGMDGNILEVLGCEVDWDNLSVKFVPRRGADRDITIRYGVNIIDARQEESLAGVVQVVYGYVKKGDDALVMGNPVLQDVTAYPRIALVDLSATFEDGDTINAATIKTHTETWVQENDVFTPKINFTVDYLSLQEVVPGFYDLHVGDTVSVILPQLERYSARVQEIVYDALLDRIESVTIGNYQDTLADTLNGIRKSSATLKAYPVGSFYTSAIKTNPAAIFGGEWTLVSSTATSFTFQRTN